MKIAVITTCIILFGTIHLFPQTDEVYYSEPETDATSELILNGLVASQRFGSSTTFAGDLNGDGFGDVAVGAHATSSNTGRVYVYFGGTILNSIPDFIQNGETTNNYYGWSVSGAGDVNGDGYDDLIIGAYGYSSFTGRAYIYFGGESFDNSADVILTGPSTSHSFGVSVSSAGDVNGDGFDDVIIGASAFGTNTGKAFVYYGGANMDNVADKVFQGQATSNYFGFSVCGAGDFNGDGFDDIAVGAYGYSSSTGRAYIYFGSASMDTLSDVILSGEGGSFGQCVSSAGDNNGDGYSDLIVGAGLYSSGRGRAYVYYGNPSGENTADVVIDGEAPSNNFGRALCSAGDVNGDGFSDVLISGQGNSSNTGKVYLYLGGDSMDSFADIMRSGEDANNYFGASVAGGGDINGDGYSDFVVGAYGHGSNKGRAYIFRNTLKGYDIADITVTGESTSGYASSLNGIGDFNGDGYDDYAVCAPEFDVAKGRVYIYFGSAQPDGQADLTITGAVITSRFGSSVSGGGDINGDGYHDLVIGATEFSSLKGRCYIFFGGSSPDTIADAYMTGISSSDLFAFAVASSGDLNGDGYCDVLVGSPGYLNGRGRIAVFYGGSPLDTISDGGYTGGVINDNFGQSLSYINDFNGDGFSDMIIGKPGFSSNTGSANIYFGNGAGTLAVYGIATGDFFGNSVSDAGDYNGDGFSDVIVGAPYSNTGKVYMYYGSQFPDNTHDLLMGPNALFFGYSADGGGDVNDDGFADIVIGAYGDSRSFIYYGSFAPDSLHDVFLTNNQYADFGYDVSFAGDVNNDGKDDIVIAEPSNLRHSLHLTTVPSVKPILLSVKDVPNDQGGKVKLKWARSAYDIAGENIITDYLIQRSDPPGTGGFFWENVAVIPATKESFYAFNDNTPYDSTSNGNGNLYYRITARTANQNNFWRSAVLYGRSIDNISPPVVSSFAASGSGANVILNWDVNDAPDLFGYVIYRSYSQEIDPDTEPVFAEVNDTSYTDSSPLAGLYNYFIVAKDIHGNKSPVSSAGAPRITLDLVLFIEGFYDPLANMQISDTIHVELRNSAPPYGIIDRASAVMAGNGNCVLNFGDAPNGNYFLAVNHRNSIQTWSSGTLFLSRNSPASYDFSTSASQAFGNNLIQVDTSPLRFAVFSGDVNLDGTVDASDVSAVDNDAANFNGGYVATDLNGDEFVDGSDFAIADNNAGNFVSVSAP